MEKLRKLGVNRLIICGLQTKWCIDSTARHAYSLGFDVTVVEEEHSTMDTHTLLAAKVIKHHNRIFSGDTQIKNQVQKNINTNIKKEA